MPRRRDRAMPAITRDLGPMVAAVSAARAAAGVVPARLHGQKGVMKVSRGELINAVAVSPTVSSY